MFNERQKICIANVVLTFTENFMENGDTIFLAIVQKIFRDNLQIPFNEASLRSIPKINSMDVTQELSSLNATQRDEFNNLMDTMLDAIELNPYYQEKVKRGARTYLNAIKATSQLGQF